LWLRGEGPLYAEKPAPPLTARLLVSSNRPQELSEELLYQFPLHIRLPALNEVAEDIPYHLSVFLRDKPVRYVRYFFLLKTFFHQWEGNLLELSHYLDQALAYYQSMASVAGFSGGEEVFGEKRLRFYQDVLKGEWWYYPYRFRSDFTGRLQHILKRTDFRDRMIREGLVVPLMKEESGYLVLDLQDAEFEKKANAIYTLFREYLDDQTAADHEQKGG
jgi:hypothetical protein